MSLERFIKAQEYDYEIALAEMKSGRKRSHWMWYIFPPIKGLGYSSTAQYYAIQDKAEAISYLQHSVLGTRLVEICEVLLALECDDPHIILGYPDDMKLKSSMTLFSLVSEKEVFQKVLEKFFAGETDQRTVEILEEIED